MTIDKILQATLLLTVYFNKREAGQVKPLTPLEYGRFALWLHQKGISPADLLDDSSAVLESWLDPKKKITAERIETLLARGASMGFALEHWRKHGVWILSRAHEEYPRSIRKHLGDARPPILFGIGDKSLLNKPGIGFVGSRSIDADDEKFTRKLAKLAVEQGYAVVSGGAKGIDQTSMEAALAHGGECVGVLSDSLLKASTKKIYREAIQDGRLTLISPYYPEAGFSAGNAMGRNKYIYTLSKAVVAVKSDYDKGGTWSGAVENQKKGWVPLLVRNADNQGNQELIKRGGIAIGEELSDLNAIISSAPTCQSLLSVDAPSMAEKPDLFSQTPEAEGIEQPKPISEEEILTETPDLQPEPEDNRAVEAASNQVISSDIALTTAEETAAGVEPTQPPEPLGQEPPRDSTASESQSDTQTALGAARQKLVGSELEHYGELFTVFLSGVFAIESEAQSVTSSDLQEKFPELPPALIKKWLAALEQLQVLERSGRKLSYTRPKHDLFTR